MRKRNFSAYFFILFFFCLATLITSMGESCYAQDKQGSYSTISLGQGVTAAIKSIRTWESFDNSLIGTSGELGKSYEHWLSGGLAIKRLGDLDSKILSGKREVSQGASSYTMNVSRFAPYNGEAGVKASGRFCELLLWFTNKGKQQSTIWFHNKGQNGLDAQLLLTGQDTIGVQAFLMPGLGVAPISLVTSWKGQLGIKLNPGEETWLLLVFDVPHKYSSARFQLKNTSPFVVRLPDTK